MAYNDGLDTNMRDPNFNQCQYIFRTIFIVYCVKKIDILNNLIKKY